MEFGEVAVGHVVFVGDVGEDGGTDGEAHGGGVVVLVEAWTETGGFDVLGEEGFMMVMLRR